MRPRNGGSAGGGNRTVPRETDRARRRILGDAAERGWSEFEAKQLKSWEIEGQELWLLSGREAKRSVRPKKTYWPDRVAAFT